MEKHFHQRSISEVVLGHLSMRFCTSYQTLLTKRYINGRKIDVKKNILDISNAEKFLKWSPKTSIQDGIPWMLKYFKSYDE